MDKMPKMLYHNHTNVKCLSERVVLLSVSLYASVITLIGGSNDDRAWLKSLTTDCITLYMEQFM